MAHEQRKGTQAQQTQSKVRSEVRSELRRKKRTAEAALESGGQQLLQHLNETDALGSNGALHCLARFCPS